MKIAILAAVLCCAAAGADSDEIVALERKALDGLQRGDPGPALAICDPDITYFHIVTNGRLDGLPAVKALFEAYRGQPLFDRYEMADAKVQSSGGGAAVLTYVLVRHVGDDTSRWYATQVYRKTDAGWRVIHSHWSAAGRPQ